MDSFFKKASDLTENENKYFYVPGDLDNNLNKSNVEILCDEMSVEDINKYLKTIVSGKKFDMECELGTLCGEGSCIVSFEELKTMIDEGEYNIIEAECFNKEMISIKYQQFTKEYSKKF